jgi:acylphosphatase
MMEDDELEVWFEGDKKHIEDYKKWRDKMRGVKNVRVTRRKP